MMSRIATWAVIAGLVVTFGPELGAAHGWVVQHLEAMEYPKVGVAAGSKGTVILECQLSEDGRVRSVKVIKRADKGGILAHAAAANARKWRFASVKEGARLPDKVQLTYTFRLEGWCYAGGSCKTRFSYDFPASVTVVGQQLALNP